MPIYEYECPKCGVFEAIQKMSDKPLKAKPDCCEKNCPKKAERRISASAFHLKGSGWYKSDYSSGSGSSSGSGKSKKASKAESSSDGGSSSDSGSDSGEKKGSETKDSLKTKGACGSGCGCH